MGLAWILFKNYLLSRRSGALVRIIAWHCILGVGMGVAALIIVLSVMEGFNRSIRTRMFSVEPHLVFTQKTRPTDSQAHDLRHLIDSVSAEGVEDVERFETQDVILRTVDGTFSGVIAKGYQSDSIHGLLSRIWKLSKQETPPPQVQSADLSDSELILGWDLARSLGIFEGDEVLLIPPETLLLPKGEAPKFQKFKVRSLVSTQMPDFDSKLVFYNIDKFKGQSASREAGFEVRLKNPYEAEEVKEKLKKRGIDVQTWGDRDTSLFFALKMESAAMTLFLSLAVLITSFSIVIVMVLLMSQKRQDIGMLMALGMPLAGTRRVFLRVGLYLSFIGVVGGIALGSAVALFLDHHPMELLPDIYTDSTLPSKLTPKIFLFVATSSAMIAIIGSWLPVWRYVKGTPSEALRKPMDVKV